MNINTLNINKKLTLLILLVFVFVSLPFSSVSALSGGEFRKDRIIDDAKFYRASSMSATDIQSFLNSKLSSCDTNGQKSKSYYYNSSTGRVNDSRDTWVTTSRATYGLRYFNWSGTSSKAPYICLKNYKANTPAKSLSTGLCSAMTAKTARSAAQILNDISNACGVDSKVLLVMLEKEQGLVSDDWPWASQYRIAMGYGCPDDGSCNSAYYGFFNQVYNAARQLKNYRKNSSSFNYASGRTSFVAYQANAPSCSGTNITMSNAATAALYNYTPYQPNNAALSNLYGTGNSCSAYGNRNFWRMYNDWFGSTYATCTSSDSAGSNVYRLFSTKLARHYFTAFECEANRLDVSTSYSLEGVAFQQAPLGTDGRTGVFRLFQKSTGRRFWTSSPTERDNLVAKHRFRLEGTSFIGYTGQSTEPTKKPVYRLFNSETGNHLWTKSLAEKDSVDSKPSWRYEGVAYYVY